MLKRRKQMVLLAAGALLFAAAVGIIWLGNKRSRRERSEILKIGVLIYKEDDTFVSGIVEEMKRQFKDYERESGSRIRLDFSYAEENQSIQNEQIDKYLSLDYDVLCVNLVDRTEAAIVIEKAKSADVPVVFFNREPVAEDLQQWDRLYYVGSDAKESGTLEGLLVVDYYKKYPEQLDRNQDGVIQYVLLEGESRHQDSLIRTEYSVQTLVDAGLILERLDGGIANWVRSQGEALTTQWLKEYGNEIELIISNNDDMALGAIDAVENWHISFSNIVGIDGTPQGVAAVESGKMIGTIVAGQEDYAKVLLDLAERAAREETLDGLDIREDKSVRIPMYSINCDGEIRRLEESRKEEN
ncbi:MAG: galactose ABC transporter substrate-binding protein [Lachnospiraceae bacterium]|jgi:methyl-galactoside transport system substrate-binding protein|nr:galactose ABC transporter substrate-binding protein [Lachnospiraceae bacterium]